ncbi:MAG: hypothetical protein BWY70_01141 [Bacteroidetes bacterium ADurb.Bin408]|nr:MAG: hypothetical protein BWY70_01141 [Bacteroidetes bacterium ADurb.Bin408]
MDYTLFRKSSANAIVIGKEDCLYEEGYILDYTGKNFVGKSFIDKQLEKTKKIQDFLKKEKNIDLLVVYAPGKASFYPEYIPARYHPESPGLSNYKYYAQQSARLKLKHLDLNAWFIAMKDTSRYPLYPRYGIHWSTYGMCLAIDTLIRFMESARNADMLNPVWNGIRTTDSLKDADYDIEKTLNLLYELPHETMAYPDISYPPDTALYRPDVLTIADSYYWSIFNSGMPEKVFGNHEFWYYNYTIYPDCWGDNVRYVDHNKDREYVEKQDVILIIITEINLYRGFFKFVDKLYNQYFPDEPTDVKYDYKVWYLNDDYWLKNLIHRADSCRMTPAELLDRMAEDYALTHDSIYY